MEATEIAAQLAEQHGEDGARAALRMYDHVCRHIGRREAAPYLLAAIMLCWRQ